MKGHSLKQFFFWLAIEEKEAIPTTDSSYMLLWFEPGSILIMQSGSFKSTKLFVRGLSLLQYGLQYENTGKVPVCQFKDPAPLSPQGP